MPRRVYHSLRPHLPLLLAMVALYVLPRAALYHGVSFTSPFTFADMVNHLYHLDLVTKQATLPAEITVADPFLVTSPDLLQRIHPARWPLGLLLAALPFCALFGPLSIWTVQLVNALFAGLILVGVAGLGRLLGGLRLGLWAALLTCLCPPLVAASWYFSLDFALTGAVLMGLLLLWHCRGFTRLRVCLLLGLCSGLALFIKASYVLYLLGPAVYAALSGLLRGPRRRALAGLALASGLTLGLAAALHGPDLPYILGESWLDLKIHAASDHLPASAIRALSAQWFLSQPTFAALNFPLPLLLLVLPGLALLHLPGRGGPPPGLRGFLLTFLWSALLILTLMSNKLERYLHPVYPLLCLLAVWGAGRLPRRWVGPARLVLAVAFAAVLALTQVHPTPWWTNDLHDSPRRREWNEYSMPGLARLARLRADAHEHRCRMEPLVDQLAAWARRDPARRPFVLANMSRLSTAELELPYAELVLLTAQRLRDRLVLSEGLFGQRSLPGGVPMAPNLVVVHSPVYPLDDSGLPRLAEVTLPLVCERGTFPFTLRLVRSNVAAPLGR